MPVETIKNDKNEENEKEDLSVSSLIQKLKATADDLEVVYNPQRELEYNEKIL